MKNNPRIQNTMLIIGGLFIFYSIIGYFFKGTQIADRIKVASSAFSILLSFSKIPKVSSIASDKRKNAVKNYSSFMYYFAIIVGVLILFNVEFINIFIQPLYDFLNSGYAMFLSFGVTIISITFQEMSEDIENEIKEKKNDN